jgi:hypothetical protein
MIKITSKPLHIFWISFILLTFVLKSASQYYISGQDPASLRWRQIHSSNFQIIYPEKIESKAQHLANILEYIYTDVSQTLSHKPAKISVILHNHTVQSNGLVTWAPKRIETFTMPPQDQYPEPWPEQLAIHEFRHVVQIDKLRQGITEMMYAFFGEQAIGVVTSFLPDWFYEGDAICTETALSNSGRGRIAAFKKEIKAIELDPEKNYSFEKSAFGSYQNHVPTHYHYGYFLTAHARKKYGKHVWDNTVSYVANHPHFLFPMYFGLKKYTGLSKRGLYKETLSSLHKDWHKQKANTDTTPFIQWNNRNSSTYTSYRFPQYINDSITIVEKSGIHQINSFVIINKDGTEKKFHTPGFYSPLKLSYADSLIVWGEYVFDLRWTHRNYYVVKAYDLRKEKQKTLTHKTRYFAPDLSANGKKIAVVKVDLEDHKQIMILNSQNGAVLDSIPIEPGKSVQTPHWINNGKALVMTMISGKGKSIVTVDLHTKTMQTIFGPTHTNISKPIGWKEYILFRADYSGVDNIYAVHTKTEKIFQLTSAPLGAYDPCVHPKGNKMIYSNYTSDGYDLTEVHFDSLLWRPLNEVRNFSPDMYKTLAKQEDFVLNTREIPDTIYNSKKYRKWAHLFRIHSWSPFYMHYNTMLDESPEIFPGVTLLSQNPLGTAVTSLGYGYARGKHRFFNTFRYMGWYPVINITTTYGDDAPIVPNDEEYSNNALHDNFFSIESRLSLPLNLTRNKYIRGVEPSVSHTYYNSYFVDQFTGKTVQGKHTYQGGIYLYNLLKTSHRDILPRFGQKFGFYYTRAPHELMPTEMIYGMGSLYFPGLMKHHTIKISGGFQKNLASYYLSTPLDLKNFYLDSDLYLYAKQIEKLSFNYTFPIAYPDLRIFSIIYIKRLRANVFFDHINITHGIDRYNSVLYNRASGYPGIELTFDFHLFQMRFPLNAGIRYYINNDVVEPIFSLDLPAF